MKEDSINVVSKPQKYRIKSLGFVKNQKDVSMFGEITQSPKKKPCVVFYQPYQLEYSCSKTRRVNKEEIPREVKNETTNKLCTTKTTTPVPINGIQKPNKMMKDVHYKLKLGYILNKEIHVPNTNPSTRHPSDKTNQ